jgi:hypothetical protein
MSSMTHPLTKVVILDHVIILVIINVIITLFTLATYILLLVTVVTKSCANKRGQGSKLKLKTRKLMEPATFIRLLVFITSSEVWKKQLLTAACPRHRRIVMQIKPAIRVCDRQALQIHEAVHPEHKIQPTPSTCFIIRVQLGSLA